MAKITGMDDKGNGKANTHFYDLWPWLPERVSRRPALRHWGLWNDQRALWSHFLGKDWSKQRQTIFLDCSKRGAINMAIRVLILPKDV